MKTSNLVNRSTVIIILILMMMFAGANVSGQSSDYDSNYQTSFQWFQSGQYEKAISGFKTLLSRSRAHNLSDNCQYWIGECYYAKKNYLKAIIEFEKVFTFPVSNKKDDAQLKLGMCYLKLDDKEGARREFTRLLSKYPESEFVGPARKILEDL